MTMIRPRSTFALLAMAGATVLLVASGPAQDDDGPPAAAARPEVAPASGKTFLPYRRVPSNFGKVGLSTQQKEEIYVLRGRYQSEISELRQRIEELSRREMEECESILTESQRKLLEQLRAASRPPVTGNGE